MSVRVRTTFWLSALQQPNRCLESGRAEVHVALRRAKVTVTGEFLDGAGRRALHGEVRAEGVTQDVNAFLHSGAPGHAPHDPLHDFLRQRLCRACHTPILVGCRIDGRTVTRAREFCCDACKMQVQRRHAG
jgi:hypothetical protein